MRAVREIRVKCRERNLIVEINTELYTPSNVIALMSIKSVYLLLDAQRCRCRCCCCVLFAFEWIQTNHRLRAFVLHRL